MLNRKNAKVTKDKMYIDNLKQDIELNICSIKGSELRNLLGKNIKEIDEIIDSIKEIPIKKYKENTFSSTYYSFPIELLISNYILLKSNKQ